MMPMDEFMEFAGYRNMVINDKVEECLDAARRGETSINIDAGDLTSSEIEQMKNEVQRRLERGDY